MDIFGSIWNLLWSVFSAFVWVGALIALFVIISDLFRDRSLKSWQKAVWFIVLLIVPFLGSLIYLIARGNGMAERGAAQVQRAKAAQDDYIRDVAGSSPSDEIAKAKKLLDDGVIDEAEYASLKAKALS